MAVVNETLDGAISEAVCPWGSGFSLFLCSHKQVSAAKNPRCSAVTFKISRRIKTQCIKEAMKHLAKALLHPLPLPKKGLHYVCVMKPVWLNRSWSIGLKTSTRANHEGGQVPLRNFCKTTPPLSPRIKSHLQQSNLAFGDYHIQHII